MSEQKMTPMKIALVLCLVIAAWPMAINHGSRWKSQHVMDVLGAAAIGAILASKKP